MKKIYISITFIILFALNSFSQTPVENVSGYITTSTTWTKDKIYLLNGFVYVTSGATLTIEPGTLIKGDKATKGSLIITRGCKLMADGTQDEPIVFTSNGQ
jgi:hypothetical protein